MPGQIDRRVAVVLVIVAAIGAAIASGVALSDDSENVAPSLSSNRPAPVATPPSGGGTTSPVAEPRPDRVALSEPVVDNDASRRVESRPDSVAARTPPAGTPAARAGAATGGALTPVPPRPTPPAAAASVQAPSATPPQAPVSDPSVYVACKGFPDICSAIRAEMMRAFQRDGVIIAADRGPADVGVTALVTLVSETASSDFATPMLTRTYSVELTSDSRGAMLAMPEPRRFSFDARVGSERLAENARLIAADATQSVRAFLTRNRP